MNTLPSISAHIDEKVINKIIQDNFAALAPTFYTLTSNWFVRAYNYYKDIDKFVIIIYLIHQDLIYFRQNGVKIDYDTFYKDKSIEIKKINISDISKDLGVPKESIRRKVLELENDGTIKRVGKKIFIVRNTLYSAEYSVFLTINIFLPTLLIVPSFSNSRTFLLILSLGTPRSFEMSEILIFLISIDLSL